MATELVAELLLALAVLTGLALAPRWVDDSRLRPSTGIGLNLLSIAARAQATILVIAAVIFLAPKTGAFHTVTHWCWHGTVPVVGATGISGRWLAGASLGIPILAMLISIGHGFIGSRLQARRLGRWIESRQLESRPDAIEVIESPEVLAMAVGSLRPRLVISTGALLAFDDGELRAVIEHERGHIARRHHWILSAARVLVWIGRMLPLPSPAMSKLAYHLERDADEYAVRATGDPLALASSVGKAARGPAPAMALTGVGTPERLRALIERDIASRRGPSLLTLTAIATIATLALAVLIPALAHAGVWQIPLAAPDHLC